MHYYFWLNLGQIFVKLAAEVGCEPGLGWMLVLRVSGQRGANYRRRVGDLVRRSRSQSPVQQVLMLKHFNGLRLNICKIGWIMAVFTSISYVLAFGPLWSHLRPMLDI